MLAMDAMSTATINIDDTPNLTIFEIKNKCRRMKADTGLDLVLIDYLQLMNADSKIENRQQQISTLTRNLKLMARELDCPVIVLSQLSRGPEQRDDKRPKLSDLRESGSIEQDADSVIFIYRDEYYRTGENRDDVETPVAEIIVAKNRHGSTGTEKLNWIGKYKTFRVFYRFFCLRVFNGINLYIPVVFPAEKFNCIPGISGAAKIDSCHFSLSFRLKKHNSKTLFMGVVP
jgi:replicative DNA helicase